MGTDQTAHNGDRAQRRLIEFGRAVADQTRVAMLNALIEGDGLTVAELTVRFGMHHSAIRSHLRVLEEAGLVRAHPAAGGGRGRPAKCYRVVPGAVERWGATGPHRELASMLIETVATGTGVLETGRAAGGRLARGLPTSDPMGRVEAVTARFGFEPEPPRAAGAGIGIRLAVCPFANEATASREVVCGLHRGVLEGALLGTQMRLQELRQADPHAGGCQVLLEDAQLSS